ncbi:MAG: tetratricopeptide repeat protein, partial [Cyanobacteria bacterium]|nr:tetratricopeptide repeat protein [Cyanobacteriota bacterium]
MVGVLDAPMRIGQILLDADLINPVQLSEGLEYGAAKGIFLGRAMELLKHLSDESVSRAILTQKLIRMGLSPVIAIEALKTSLKDGISLEEALQHKNEEAAKLTAHLAEEAHPELSALNLSADSPEELIKNGDSYLIHDLCQKAEQQYLKAFKALEREVGPGHIDLCPILVRLGNCNLAKHVFTRAQDCYDKVLEIRSEALGETHPQVAKAYESLADLYKAQGDDEKAMQASLQALDILEQNLPGQLGAYAAILKKLAASTRV